MSNTESAVPAGNSQSDGALMDCGAVSELISEVVDKALANEQLHQIYQHVLGCPECRARLEMECHRRQLLRGGGSLRAPSYLRQRILWRISCEKDFPWDSASPVETN